MPETNRVYQGDCMAVMRGWPDGFVDTVLADPPYGLGFMGKGWDMFGGPLGKDHNTATERSGSMHASDYDRRRDREFEAWCQSWAAELLRVCKPGATLLCFGGTRTWHRLCCAIEDAGWEITDCLMWLFGSGTTGVACNRVGRPWIGIELDPHYCDIARKRTAQAGIFTDTR